MSKARIKGYGCVEFYPMNPSGNHYELYDVAIVDRQRGAVKEQEHYISEDDYRTALYDVYGREVLDEQQTFGECEVNDNWGECYMCDCTHHVAYVIDHEEG